MAKAIYNLMKSIVARCSEATESTGNRLNSSDIMDILSKENILVLPHILGHTHTIRSSTRAAAICTTTVDVDFEFHAPDGTSMNSRATGVVVGNQETLSNELLDKARAAALESVFSLNTISLLIMGFLPNGPVVSGPAEPVIVLADARSVGPQQTVGKGKAAVDKIMAQAGLPALLTADQVAPPNSLPKTPTLPPAASALNPDARALKEWKAKVDTLDADNPGDWDEHAQALGKLKGLKDGQHRELFIAFREYAQKKQVDYDPTVKRFFLITQAA